MVFLCHYRNKLIFGFKSEGGDSGESEQHVLSRDVSGGMAQWQANSTRGCLCIGYLTDVHHVREDETAG